MTPPTAGTTNTEPTTRTTTSPTIFNPYPNTSQQTGKYTTFQSSRSTANDTKREKTINGGFSPHSTMSTKTIPFIAINDGTVRLTVKWKLSAIEYDDMMADTHKWRWDVKTNWKTVWQSRYFSHHGTVGRIKHKQPNDNHGNPSSQRVLEIPLSKNTKSKVHSFSSWRSSVSRSEFSGALDQTWTYFTCNARRWTNN